LPDRLTPAQRSALMSRIRGKNTGPERLLSQYLRRAGVYFSRNARGIPGTPDIVFRRCRLAVFADGEFWHGRRFDRWKRSLSRFWLRKIQGNITRDAAVDAVLRKAGWRSLRLWGRNIQRSPSCCVQRILALRQKLLDKQARRP
jgi:DNA mismatch endonuclease (patch repair protein)